jgi:hypothetical protein
MAVAEKVTVELELKDQQYNARVKASEREFKRSMDATERAAEDAARDIDRTLGSVPESLKAKYRELGTDIGRSFAGISRSAGLAFGAITAYSLKLASDAGEIESAFQVAFGNSTESVKAFSEQLGETAGRDAVVLRESMTRLQLVLTGTGVEAAKAADLVKALSTAGVDAGSLFNTSDAEALQKIISGLTGESEPLKAFGVVLTEAAVKAELLRLGFKGNVDAASEAAKSIARANLILKGLSVAQGDAARTADSAANTTKRMTAEFNKAARDLGTQLLPAMTQLFGAATDVLEAFNDLPGGVQVAGLAFLGLIAAGGPIAGLIANLARLRLIAIETRAAVALIGAGGGAGARGLIAGGALGAAGVGGGLLLSQGSFIEQPERTSAVVQRNLDNTLRLRPGDTRTINGLRDELRQTRRREDLIALANGTGAYAPALTPAGETGVIGGFGLGGLANGGGSGGGRARGGGRGGAAGLSDAARELEQLRSDLARVQEGQLTEAERAAKDLAETIAIIEKAAAGDLLTSREAAILSGGVAAQDLTNIKRDPLQSAVDINGRDIRAQLTAGQKEEDEKFAERGRIAAQSFIDVIYTDDIWGSLGNVFANAAARNLENALSTLFTALFQGGGQGAGILNGIGSFLGFGGGRAMGGPVRKGFAYDVGESGRERFVAPANGFIMPNMGGQAQSGRGTMKVEVKQTFSLEGATGDTQIYSNVQRMIAQGQRQTLAIVRDQAGNVQSEQRLLRD